MNPDKDDVAADLAADADIERLEQLHAHLFLRLEARAEEEKKRADKAEARADKAEALVAAKSKHIAELEEFIDTLGKTANDMKCMGEAFLKDLKRKRESASSAIARD